MSPKIEGETLFKIYKRWNNSSAAEQHHKDVKYSWMENDTRWNMDLHKEMKSLRNSGYVGKYDFFLFSNMKK